MFSGGVIQLKLLNKVCEELGWFIGQEVLYDYHWGFGRCKFEATLPNDGQHSPSSMEIGALVHTLSKMAGAYVEFHWHILSFFMTKAQSTLFPIMYLLYIWSAHLVPQIESVFVNHSIYFFTVTLIVIPVNLPKYNKIMDNKITHRKCFQAA